METNLTFITNLNETLQNKWQDANFASPMPIQSQLIPHMLDGSDVVAESPTGTGKTLAYVLPILQMVDPTKKHIQAMVIIPSQELGMQIVEVFREWVKGTDISVAQLIGGANIQIDYHLTGPGVAGAGTAEGAGDGAVGLRHQREPGGLTAAAYGFAVTQDGVGTRTVNVALAGSVFGVPNGSDVKVIDLLLAVNARSHNGLVFDIDGDGDATDVQESLLRTVAVVVFADVNQSGGIWKSAWPMRLAVRRRGAHLPQRRGGVTSVSPPRHLSRSNHTPFADGIDLPAEITRREDRLQALAEAKAKIAERIQERDDQAQQDYQEKLARREAQREAGKKPRGPEPKAPETGPKAKDQVNLTDEESRIMPSANGFLQGYNAQAAVDVDSMLVIATTLTQDTHDKQQVEPILSELKALPEHLGQPKTLLADNGYFSKANILACEKQKIEPLIALGREAHYLPLEQRLTPDAPAPESSDPLVKMAWKLKTRQGRELYGKRKSTVEPVFGIIKQVLGFRQFSLRGLDAVTGEWKLVTIAFNLKRMHVLAAG